MKNKNDNYLSGRFAFKTDIGKVRINNEDQALATINARGNILLLVCDGMGGQNKGDYASSLAVNVISDAFKRKNKFFSRYSAIRWCLKTVKKANKKINYEATKNPIYEGMGTTLTLALVVKDYMVLCQVGDSRCYSLKNKAFKQISEDQTYVAYLYRTGQIKKEEMKTHPKRHVLMNALGYYPSLELDLKIHSYNKETLLLCSDGLYNNVSDSDIANIVKGNDTVDEKVHELISLANANGGSDNIAVVLWEADK